MRKGLRISSGTLSGHQVDTSQLKDARPTSERVRQSMLSIIQNDLKNTCFVDAYAGSGIVGLEALSNGAEKVIFIDKNANNTRLLKKNCSILKVIDRIKIVKGETPECFPGIRSLTDEKRMIFFFDPPYAESQSELVMSSLRELMVHVDYGLVIWEHHHKTEIACDGEGWDMFRVERYGETQLTFLRPADSA